MELAQYKLPESGQSLVIVRVDDAPTYYDDEYILNAKGGSVVQVGSHNADSRPAVPLNSYEITSYESKVYVGAVLLTQTARNQRGLEHGAAIPELSGRFPEPGPSPKP